MTTKLTVGLVALTLVCAACASTNHYTPEVSGPGAIHTPGGGVTYKIPPDAPMMRMKLVSLGFTKDKMLHFRMYFAQAGRQLDEKPAAEYLNPSEQLLSLPESKTEILPARVYASTEKKPMINLGDKPKQAIDLMYSVNGRGEDDYPYFTLKWSVHYKRGAQSPERVETQTARFDLKNKHIEEGVGPATAGDPDFPFEDLSVFPSDSEWVSPGWMWW